VAGGDALNITTSGTASAPITYEAAPGATAIIQVGSSSWTGIQDNASWTIIKGFQVTGAAQSMSLASALNQDTNLNDTATSADGIDIGYVGDTNTPVHNIIEDNVVTNMPGGGITAAYTDYTTISGNTVSGCSHWSPYGNSGISLYGSQNSDSSTAIKNFITDNTTYNNSQEVPTQNAGGLITDGEGIIIDDNSNDQTNNIQYLGGTLVENNLSYSNGGPGLLAYDSSNVTMLYNTAVQNGTTGLNQYDIEASDAKNVVIENDIASMGTAGSPLASKSSSGVVENYNLVNGGTSSGATGSNDINASPLFVNASAANYALQAGSPAINAANTAYTAATDLVGALRPTNGGYDLGALQYQGGQASPPPTTTPVVITVPTSQASVAVTVSSATINALSGSHTFLVSGASDTFSFAGGTETVTDSGTGGNTFNLPAAGNGSAIFNAAALTDGDVFNLTTALDNTAWNGSASSLRSYLHTVSINGNTELLVSAHSSRHGGTGTLLATFDNTNASLTTILSHSTT
jgi:parallel beta-helix repeat protein